MPPRSLSHGSVEWGRVQRTSCLIYQRFRYEYPAPVRHLRHRLIVIPPPTFGDQRRTLQQLTVSAPGELETSRDAFDNTVIEFRAPLVNHNIEFESWIGVERAGLSHSRVLSASFLEAPLLVSQTKRTFADSNIQRVAADISDTGLTGLALAERINTWVFETMTYGYGQTDVHTSAAEALSKGTGVCQDYAHIMLAICRTLRMPSLYVSGHLLAEGGTHAWVEVLVPSADDSGTATAWAFDPTHGRLIRPDYVAIAAGLDYSDVAPTSGSFQAPLPGKLTTRKQIRLLEVEYA